MPPARFLAFDSYLLNCQGTNVQRPLPFPSAIDHTQRAYYLCDSWYHSSTDTAHTPPRGLLGLLKAGEVVQVLKYRGGALALALALFAQSTEPGSRAQAGDEAPHSREVVLTHPKGATRVC